MKIAIIDSGVDTKHKRLQNCKISGGQINIIGDNNYTISKVIDDELGHGTACASIINKCCPEAELIIIKVFNDQLITNERYIHYAIGHCIKIEADIINLSLGIQTDSPSHELYKICKKAHEKNIVIIAAANNDINSECYPAYFNFIWGVTAGKTKDKNKFGYIPNFPINFIAKGTTQRVAWSNNSFKIVNGTSYACAYFTGIVAQLINDKKDWRIGELEKLLIERSDPDISPLQIADHNNHDMVPIINRIDMEKVEENLFDSQKKLHWINRMALFPISEKEMKLFIDFKDQVSSRITKYIDYPKAFKRTDYHSKIDLPIQTKPLVNSDLKDFDSIVLGYFYDHQFDANIKYGYDLLHKCIEQDKNIFVFDERIEGYIKKHTGKAQFKGKLYMPKIDRDLLKKVNQFKFLPSVKVPVLCVVGTSNKQGKFTTQIQIKKILEQEGYKVSHISTEPHGELFGAQFCFPYGYNSSVKIDRYEWSIFINTLLKGIQKTNNPHLILTGTQGGTVPRRYNNPLGNETKSLDYLLGVNPDATICVINPEDTIELIENVINTVAAFTNSKPLFFTISPIQREFKKNKTGNYTSSYRLLCEEELKERIDFFQTALNKKVFNILNRDCEPEILKLIERFFS